MTINEQASLSTSTKPPSPLPSSVPITKTTTTTTNPKTTELPKIQLQRFEMDTRKRKNPPGHISKRPISASKQPVPLLVPTSPLLPPLPPTPVIPSEPIKVLPLTIYDFNGSSEYYEHMSPFIDTNALHLLCIHTVDFHRNTPATIEDIFNGQFDIKSSMILTQLFQLLQLLCDKATKTRAITIIPIATCIDLYDSHPKEHK